VTFSAEWLALREPYDHRARSSALAERFVAALPPGGSVLDLAGGTGSGARYLLRHGPELSVTVVDHDLALLDGASAAGLSVRRADLQSLDGLPAADGVQAQALLDLVSWDWLDRFVAWLSDRTVPLLAALTVDGRVHWAPDDPDDEPVQAAFRAHQQLDRGFGPSPGAAAALELAERLSAHGWAVHTAAADWVVPATDRAMVEAMVHGTAEAARQTHPAAHRVDAWAERRLRPDTSLRVGHVDLLALPPAASGRDSVA